MDKTIADTTNSGNKSLLTVANVVYGLQTASFLVGITLIIAIIINYVKLDDVRGTWLESHFRWQIRTFWYSLAWWILGGITLLVGIGFFILTAAVIWFIYRIVKGWLYLNDRKPMYVTSPIGA